MTPVLSLNVLIVSLSISISFLNFPYIFVHVQQAVYFVTGFIFPPWQTDNDIYNYHHKHQGCLTISLAIICQLIRFMQFQARQPIPGISTTRNFPPEAITDGQCLLLGFSPTLWIFLCFLLDFRICDFRTRAKVSQFLTKELEYN